MYVHVCFPAAIDIAASLMEKGEVCQVRSSPRFTYGALGRCSIVYTCTTCTLYMYLNVHASQRSVQRTHITCCYFCVYCLSLVLWCLHVILCTRVYVLAQIPTLWQSLNSVWVWTSFCWEWRAQYMFCLSGYGLFGWGQPKVWATLHSIEASIKGSCSIDSHWMLIKSVWSVFVRMLHQDHHFSVGLS